MPVSRPVSLGWTVAAAASAVLVALALAPPFLGGEAGAFVRHAFAAVCHQLPERTPHLGGGPVALCHRCTGVVLGLAGGLLAAPALAARWRNALARSGQGRLLLAAAVPAAIDWLLGATGLWANTPASRVATGALFGLVAGVILAANLLAPPRRSLSSVPSP